MRVVDAVAIFLSLGTAITACGGSSNAGDHKSTDGGFQPAQVPNDLCSLLSSGDVATVLGNSGVEHLSDPGVSNPDAWNRACFWSLPSGPHLKLDLAGALTLGGKSSLLFPIPASNRGGTREELQGLGDVAAYFETSIIDEVGVVAYYGSYSIELDADSVTPRPGKEPLVALVRKVIGQLR
jgi:hypothetical protein